jgi:hypothetical protein
MENISKYSRILLFSKWVPIKFYFKIKKLAPPSSWPSAKKWYKHKHPGWMLWVLNGLNGKSSWLWAPVQKSGKICERKCELCENGFLLVLGIGTLFSSGQKCFAKKGNL